MSLLYSGSGSRVPSVEQMAVMQATGIHSCLIPPRCGLSTMHSPAFSLVIVLSCEACLEDGSMRAQWAFGYGFSSAQLRFIKQTVSGVWPAAAIALCAPLYGAFIMQKLSGYHMDVDHTRHKDMEQYWTIAMSSTRSLCAGQACGG